MRKRFIPVALLSVGVLSGCESSVTSEKILKLQEQIGRVAQQVSETKKQVDGLQEANQRNIKAMEELERTVEHFAAAKGGAHAVGGKSEGEAAPQTASSKQKTVTEQDIAALSPSPGKTSEAFVSKIAPLVPPATGEIGAPAFQKAGSAPSGTPQTAASKESEAAITAVSCGRVWKQLGQGKSPEAAARALGVPVAAIQACEQKIGRSSASR